jgi:hypothetical protein
VSNSGDGRVEKYDGAGHFKAAWGLDAGRFVAVWGMNVAGGVGYEICTVAANASWERR